METVRAALRTCLEITGSRSWRPRRLCLLGEEGGSVSIGPPRKEKRAKQNSPAGSCPGPGPGWEEPGPGPGWEEPGHRRAPQVPRWQHHTDSHALWMTWRSSVTRSSRCNIYIVRSLHHQVFLENLHALRLLAASHVHHRSKANDARFILDQMSNGWFIWVKRCSVQEIIVFSVSHEWKTPLLMVACFLFWWLFEPKSVRFTAHAPVSLWEAASEDTACTWLISPGTSPHNKHVNCLCPSLQRYSPAMRLHKLSHTCRWKNGCKWRGT